MRVADAVAAGEAAQEGGNAAEEGAKDLGEELGISREAKAEPAGEGEGPLPIGSAGQNAGSSSGQTHAFALAVDEFHVYWFDRRADRIVKVKRIPDHP